MKRYETPASLARALARYAPQNLKRLLDPAVGNGLLIEPFKPFFSNKAFEIVAIDTDSRSLKQVDKKYRRNLSSRLTTVHDDFFAWSREWIERKGALFDCVVMNPPFAARRKKWRSLLGLKKLISFPGIPKKGPIETGFLLAAISLLRKGGRLLAVLPASSVSSPALQWIRTFISAQGAILSVHELPHFTFSALEGRVYILVFEKGGTGEQTILLNHDLHDPEMLPVEKTTVLSMRRWDYGYQQSISKLKKMTAHKLLGWKSIAEIAAISRGTEKTPKIGKDIVHTGHYSDGFWKNSAFKQTGRLFTQATKAVSVHDILVKRVSRRCSQSFGFGLGIEGALCSDCVLIIRPKRVAEARRLLFAIRSFMALDFAPSLLERGTGASYLAQSDLSVFEIPANLSAMFPALFKRYVDAIRRKSYASMVRTEKEASQSLEELIHDSAQSSCLDSAAAQ
jgi:hypothetical protein